MNSNFKKSWSFWGGRKRFDHQFNNSFENDFEGPRVRLEDRFQDPAYKRNQFQTRSLRLDRWSMVHHNEYKSFNSSVNNELDPRQQAHSRWSKNIQRSLGFETLVSPHSNKFGGREYAHHSNAKPSRPPLLSLPRTSQNIMHDHQAGPAEVGEPIYENIKSLHKERPALLPTPMGSSGVQPLHFPLEDEDDQEMEMTPDLPPRNKPPMGPNSKSTHHKGGTRLNKAFRGVCTSMQSLSRRFRKKNRHNYQLDGSPCTPRMTPGSNLYPFDLNTPITPHSFKKEPKRLQSSAKRELLGKENYGISRTPNHLSNRTTWLQYSPMQVPDNTYLLK